MTSQAVERTWIHTGGYRGLRGEWVNNYHYYEAVYVLLAEWLARQVFSMSGMSGQHVEMAIWQSRFHIPL